MYKMVNGKKRIFYLDFVRALAIVLVLLAHITRAFFQNAPAGSLNAYIVAPLIDFGVLGVPLFLMISGALLLNRDYELGSFLKRRYTRVLLPFLFWGLILPFVKMTFENYDITVVSYFTMFIDNIYWFVWMILGIYLFIPVINSFIKEFGMKGTEYFLAIWMVIMCLNTIHQYPFHQFELSYFAGYLGFFVLGYYLTNKKFSISDSNVLKISFIIFAVFTLINMDYTITGAIADNKLIYYKYKTIITVMQSIGLFMFLRYFALVGSETPGSIKNRIYMFFKESFAFKIVFLVSTFSYGIYLAHYIPLIFLKWFSKHYVPIFSRNPIWLPVVLIAILAVTILVLWLLDKIPPCRYITGAH